MQTKEKVQQKCPFQMGEWAGSRRSTTLEVPRPQAFIGIGDVEVISTGKLG
jgi:hypothetical protein